jgi:hypothetical protein
VASFEAQQHRMVQLLRAFRRYGVAGYNRGYPSSPESFFSCFYRRSFINSLISAMMRLAILFAIVSEVLSE